MVAVSTAIWKLSAYPEARDRFRQLGVVHFFVRQLYQTAEEVPLSSLVRCYEIIIRVLL